MSKQSDLDWAEKCFKEATGEGAEEVMEEMASLLEVFMESAMLAEGDRFVPKLAALSQALHCCQQLVHAWCVVHSKERGIEPDELEAPAKAAYDVFTRRMDKTLFRGRNVLADGGAERDGGETSTAEEQVQELVQKVAALFTAPAAKKGELN